MGSSSPTPATVNIVMPWREDFKLADYIELPDKVLSALAYLIKARLRGFKVKKGIGNATLSMNNVFNNKARDNADW